MTSLVNSTNLFFFFFFKELLPIYLKLFTKKTEEEGTNLFYEASVTLIPKPKTSTDSKTTDQYPFWKQPQKLQQNPAAYKKDYVHVWLVTSDCLRPHGL